MESFSEDTLFNITSYLTSHEILNLALTCRHFGGKPGGASINNTSKKKRKTKRRKKNNTTNNNEKTSTERQWSLMEEMAKRRVEKTKRDTNWQGKWCGTDAYKLTRRAGSESWIRVDNCIQKMSSELVFHRLIGSGGAGVGYVRKNPSHIEMKSAREVIPNEGMRPNSNPEYYPTMVNSIAVCQDVMTEGRHYAKFTILQDGWIGPGIMYSIKNCHDAALVKGLPLYEAGGWSHALRSYVQLCDRQEWGNFPPDSYRPCQFLGEDYPRGILFQPKGTVIGIVLDLDEDRIQMYISDVIKYQFSGGLLGGQYSWATLISRTNDDRGAVKVERGIPPPPPLAEYDTNWMGEVIRPDRPRVL
jgi:hypothetical protein